jgi:hypothetical protein
VVERQAEEAADRALPYLEFFAGDSQPRHDADRVQWQANVDGFDFVAASLVQHAPAALHDLRYNGQRAAADVIRSNVATG